MLEHGDTRRMQPIFETSIFRPELMYMKGSSHQIAEESLHFCDPDSSFLVQNNALERGAPMSGESQPSAPPVDQGDDACVGSGATVH